MTTEDKISYIINSLGIKIYKVGSFEAKAITYNNVLLCLNTNSIGSNIIEKLSQINKHDIIFINNTNYTNNEILWINLVYKLCKNLGSRQIQ